MIICYWKDGDYRRIKTVNKQLKALFAVRLMEKNKVLNVKMWTTNHVRLNHI